MGVQLQYLDVLGPKDIETAFQPQARAALTQSWPWEALFSFLSERRLRTSR